MTIPKPYNHPLLPTLHAKDHGDAPPSIRHVALASKSYRAYGLRDVDAWKVAFEARKRVERAHRRGRRDNGGGETAAEELVGGEEEDEELDELMHIQKAIETALSDDAGGFGTAGFHKNRVTNVHLSQSFPSPDGTPQTVYIASLIPCHPETGEPLDGWQIASTDDEGNVQPPDSLPFRGNDEYHLLGPSSSRHHPHTHPEPPPFRIRITVSHADEALAAKKYYDGLFAVGRELYQLGDADARQGARNDMTVGEFADANGQMRRLRDRVEQCQNRRDRGCGTEAKAETVEHANGQNEKTEEEGDRPLGYLVEMMLLDPHVPNDAWVVPPPDLLNKADSMARSTVPIAKGEIYDGVDGDVDAENGKSVFDRDICVSPQFVEAGPWEKANLEAFDHIGLDIRKALVRVEFPVFPEGRKDKTFREVYQLNARLKSGSFATVCRGTHRATGKKVAIKCVLRMDLPPNDDAAIYDEVLILSTLRHKYICPLIDFFEERECYFFVMELMYGGDLFDRIGMRKTYSEEDARDLCRKMLESVRYCHENSVAHCDMKPKNLLLISDDDDVDIKLADFGFATRVYEPCSLTKQCGTPFFVAPEVLLRTPYDQRSDMWSVGVIIYLLLGGDLPFMGRSQKELFRKIVVGTYEFPDESWSHVSDEAKDLVSKLLVTDPAQRISSRDALASPWMRKRGQLLAMNNLIYTSQRLKTFNARMKLRSSMIAVVTTSSLSLAVKRAKSAARDALGLTDEAFEELNELGEDAEFAS
mmetsp:Transcript_13697/g.26115  ORF Transcript_13697/g.26115 Transcript_13697/m.26115 type:complete len:758 (-) Transcript_13697:124-2397(-)